MNVTRYIVEFYAGTAFGGFVHSSDAPGNYATEKDALEVMVALHHRHPSRGYRVQPQSLTADQFEEQEHIKKLRNICDDILRQVVCDCGKYRHHGVSWMLEGSGEGLSVAVDILRKAGL